MIWLRIALLSALARKSGLLIMVLSTAISVAILLGVFKIRDDTKTSFSNAISGVDLVVGAKGSPTELILYSVCHIGRATNTIAASYEKILMSMKPVAWVVPVQLGDSFRGYPVVGTSVEFFTRIKAQGRHLELSEGKALTDPTLFEVVLGHNVTMNTKLKLGEQIAITHGSGSGPKQDHSNSPFRIVGVLKPNGTPIDNAVFISTNAFDALHDIEEGGIQFAKLNPDSQVSAFYVGLKDRGSVFSARRQIDALPNAGLMGVMPGVALDDLWSTMEVAENALLIISLGVLITTILGITATLLVSLENRRRELAIFRAIGAKPYQLLRLVLFEALFISIIGIALGWLLLQMVILFSADYFRTSWGVVTTIGLPSANDLLSLLLLVIVVVLCACIPAIKAYRMALNEELNPPST
jgi:putative ABC transport system permease protein